VIIFALASLVAGTVIAEVGGCVRHEEFRRGTPPKE